MTAPVPPSHQPVPPQPGPPAFGPPQGYANPQPPVPGQPAAYAQGAPYGYPQPGAPVARRGNAGAGIALGLVTMLAGAAAYGFIMKATNSQWSYFALALSMAVALALGRVGGRNPLLPVLGALFSLLGVFLGQLFFIYLVLHQQYGLGPGDVFGSEFGDTMQGWKAMMDAKDIFFYLVAGIEGFVFTRRFAR
ncbi:hypothetical protein [Kitasatospora sp. LaBMicrA B282]|uniref:hypothetical protein n=1 Tax=Kitasatospora sp. LaBMicrA B282 TaxID=3420949 RepID=UPI003D120FD7